MTTLTETVDGVIGVDTHRDTLAAAAVTAIGASLGCTEAFADAGGYRRLFQFAHHHLPDRRCWAIEATSSYGAGLTAFGIGQGERVVAINHLKSLIVSAPEDLPAELRGRTSHAQITSCAKLRDRPARDIQHRTTVRALRRTARRILQSIHGG